MEFDFDIQKNDGYIPSPLEYECSKLTSGSFGCIFRYDDEEENSVIEKRFLETKNDLYKNGGTVFISFVKEIFIQNLLNKYLNQTITTSILGYEFMMEYKKNKSIIEKYSFYSNCIDNDLRDISGMDNVKENFIEITRKILIILNKIHNLDIVHLDLKPGNFLVTDDLDIFLIDFGLSRICNSTFNCKKNCHQQLFTQPYRSCNNIKYIQKYRCNKDCSHNVDLKREDLFAVGPMLYELWEGVDEYFVDIPENAKEKRNHYNYFKKGKWMKKYGDFVDSVIHYFKEHNMYDENEINNFRTLLFALVDEEKYQKEVFKLYSYEIMDIGMSIFNSDELKLIELLKLDDLSQREFSKLYKDREVYSYEVLQGFLNFTPSNDT